MAFSIDEKIFNEDIEFLREVMRNTKVGDREKTFALKRLNQFYSCKS